MEEIKKAGTYGEYKQMLDEELQKAAEGFVRIGYLLKVARDTDVLKESGYCTVAEFAQAEYGLTKDVVSRYIRINDRYSEDGYSEKLLEKYSKYGYGKLADMLTLPDEVVEEIPETATRNEIQAIAKEIKEEKQITDIEVMMEGEKEGQQDLENNMQKAMHQFGYENKEIYVKLWDAVNKTVYRGTYDIVIEKILDAIAPSGVAMPMVRVQGVGKLMIAIKGSENDVELLNIRTNEKESYTWEKIIRILESLCDSQIEPKKAWEKLYGEEYKEEYKEEEPVKEEVAPVQPEPEIEKKEIKEKSNEEKKETREQSQTSKRIKELFEGKEEKNVEKTESKQIFAVEMEAGIKEEIIEKVEGEIVTEIHDEKEESKKIEKETEEPALEEKKKWIIFENNKEEELEKIRKYIEEVIKENGYVEITGEVKRKW